MKPLLYFAVYALVLMNLYTWIIWPEFLYNMLWKWDIFLVLLFAPLFYQGFKWEKEIFK